MIGRMPPVGKTYMYVVGCTDHDAREAFLKRFGVRPRTLYRDGLRVYVGPVPKDPETRRQR